MASYQITKNFSMQELTFSETAARRGIYNIPSSTSEVNLGRLCRLTLQPLRDLIESPIIVTSGYRSPKLNKRIGGSKKSRHMSGCAADIVAIGYTPLELFDFIMDNRKRIAYDRLINEFSRWVHIDIDPLNPVPISQKKRKHLVAVSLGGKVIYTKHKRT